MPEPTTFGRKPTPGPSKAPDRADPHALSPRAEAFRKTLNLDEPAASSDFGQWRRSQRGRRVIFWLASLALLAPGVVSFIFDMPLEVSGGLEVLGFAGNWWLRRERKRHLKAIATWDA